MYVSDCARVTSGLLSNFDDTLIKVLRQLGSFSVDCECVLQRVDGLLVCLLSRPVLEYFTITVPIPLLAGCLNEA